MSHEEFLNEKESTLDSTPLKFGKFKGRTPDEISEMPQKVREYLIWAYENVGNGDVCSHSMYRHVGGKGGRDARASVDKTKRDYRTYKPEEDDFPGRAKDTYESKDGVEEDEKKPGKKYFDDFDDDIPF